MRNEFEHVFFLETLTWFLELHVILNHLRYTCMSFIFEYCRGSSYTRINIVNIYYLLTYYRQIWSLTMGWRQLATSTNITNYEIKQYNIVYIVDLLFIMEVMWMRCKQRWISTMMIDEKHRVLISMILVNYVWSGLFY